MHLEHMPRVKFPRLTSLGFLRSSSILRATGVLPSLFLSLISSFHLESVRLCNKPFLLRPRAADFLTCSTKSFPIGFPASFHSMHYMHVFPRRSYWLVNLDFFIYGFAAVQNVIYI